MPYLTPASLILAEYSAATKLPISTLSALFGITSRRLPGNTRGRMTEISAILAGTQKTTISDPGVLTAAEAVTVKAQVVAYNGVIAAQAQAAGATLVDINALFTKIAASGLTINGYTGTASFLGGFFSLDGIHPTNTGYAVIANTYIDAINAAFGTKIGDINLSAVAATDPLWPPNIPPHAISARPFLIPGNVGPHTNSIFVPGSPQP